MKCQCEECGREDIGRDPALWRRSHGRDIAILCSPCYAAGGVHGAGPHGDAAATELARAFDLAAATCRASGSQLTQPVRDYLDAVERIESRAIAAYEARNEA